MLNETVSRDVVERTSSNKAFTVLHTKRAILKIVKYPSVCQSKKNRFDVPPKMASHAFALYIAKHKFVIIA